MFHVHFNTNFIDFKDPVLRFAKKELDGKARKDMKKHKYFDEEFYVEFVFQVIDVGKRETFELTTESDASNFGNMRHVSIFKHVQTSHASEANFYGTDTDSDYGDADEL